MTMSILNPSHALQGSVSGKGLMATQQMPSFNSVGSAESFSAENVTVQQMEGVRAGLKPEHAGTDDATVSRFVRATNGNVKESIKRLNATCDWRAKTKPESVVCRACAKDPRSHYMHVVGHDLLGRPIIYSCLALATDRVYEANRDHMIQTFETAIKCMPEGVEQWVWVCDFHGFGMADALNVKIAKAFLEISAAHYPERLGQFVLLDAPPLFNMLWKAIQSFVDPKTFRKIRFVPYDVAKGEGKSAMMQSLRANFDERTVAWMLRETQDNRNKSIAKTKKYDVGGIHRAASAGELQGLCKELNRSMRSLVGATGEAAGVDGLGSDSADGDSARRGGHDVLHHSHSTDDDTHDHRGTCSLLQMYHRQPQILEPQGLVMRGKPLPSP